MRARIYCIRGIVLSPILLVALFVLIYDEPSPRPGRGARARETSQESVVTGSREPDVTSASDKTAAEMNPDAADSSTMPLAEIVIEGNEKISTEAIMDVIKTRAGDVLDIKRLKDDVRALVNKRWFFNVEPRLERLDKGQILTFRVFEKPVVETIVFTGNKVIQDKELKKLAEECNLHVGDLYDVYSNREVKYRILANYREQGFRHATVELEKGSSPHDRDVVFQIDEGPKVTIGSVRFNGNKSLPVWLLNLHAESATPGGFDSGHLYDSEEIQADSWRLLTLYRERGYHDATVRYTESESQDRRIVDLEFHIDEGLLQKVRNVEFRGNALISERELRGAIKLRKDDPCDQRTISNDKGRIQDLYRALGAVAPRVRPEEKTVEQPGLIDVIYCIQEGPPEEAAQTGPGNGSDQQTAVRPAVPSEIVQTGHEENADIPPPIPLEVSDALTRARSLADENRKLQATLKHQLAQTAQFTSTLPDQPRPIAPGPKSDEPRGLRDLNNLVLIGVETFDVAEIRHRLALDFDLAVAAHPDGSLFEYLKTLERVIRSGYRNRGFLDATVQVLLNNSLQHIEVRIAEGKRYRCGDVHVSGAAHVSAETLVRALTHNEKESRVLWKIGGPVPFDEISLSELQTQLKESFAQSGYYDSECDVAITRRPDENLADLNVTIANEGPLAVVKRVEVTGSERDSAADVREFLCVQPGTPCGNGLLERLKRQLLESGRYLHVEVAAEKALGPTAVEHKPYDVTIRLRDYNHAAPIVRDLPAAEQALLKLRGWVERWARGDTDEDLVVSATGGSDVNRSPADSSANQPPGGRAGELRLAMRMVVGPKRGQTITVAATHGDRKQVLDSVFIAGPEEVTFASPLRKAKFAIPLAAKNRVILNLTGNEATVEQFATAGRQFRVNIGLSWKSRSKDSDNPFEVQPRLTAAFITSLAHYEGTQCTVSEGTCEIRSDEVTLQIDMATGRLIQCRARIDDGVEMTMHLEPRAFEKELKALEGAVGACTAEYDANSPIQSIVEFVMDEYISAAVESGLNDWAAPHRALRKLVGAWSAPGLAELFRPFEFPDNDEDLFLIPTRRHQDWRKQFASGILLPVFRELAPRRGWLATAGRDAILSWVSKAPAPATSLRNAPFDDAFGPAGELLLALAGKKLDITTVREAASRMGLARLAAEDFSRAYVSLLSDESWLGRWILSLADAVRSLDESEIRSLVTLLPGDDPFPRDVIAKCLEMLARERRGPVADALPRVLDQFWEDSLRSKVRAALLELVPPPVRLEATPTQKKGRVVPAAASSDDDFLPLPDADDHEAGSEYFKPRELKFESLPP